MKKLLLACFLVTISTLIHAQQAVVIIPQFDLTGGATPVERDNITRYFMINLANKKMFRVADRGNVEKRMAEMKWQMSDYSNKEKTARLNEGINADYLIFGTISKMGTGATSQITVDAMLEELNTYEIIGGAVLTMSDIAEAPNRMQAFVTDLIQNVSGNNGGVAASAARSGTTHEGFVRIEGGTFTMGSPASDVDRFYDETQQHTVTISTFYMGKYEVTQKEWAAVMGSNPSRFKGDTLPVEMVSWYDAIEYCNKRSEKEGLRPAYTIDKSRFDPNNYAFTDSEFEWKNDTIRWIVTVNRNANGYRLPTEAEWEYACRAGTATPFSTGNNITTNQANYDEKGIYMVMTTTVGSFAPNRWGLYDMHGNVEEWCWDWYGDYSTAAQTDPAGAASGAGRVLRGGSWGSLARFLRSAFRHDSIPSNRDIGFGFRVVRP
ncbi:hypothetical protein FACS189491_03800 [Spirochaetia bacterium]|nr:hypothetical protein FACS189491_03800 [Spirochaetia bacterium]